MSKRIGVTGTRYGMTDERGYFMTDTDLVRLVAEKVMGWELYCQPKDGKLRFDSPEIVEGKYTAIHWEGDTCVRLWRGEESGAWHPLTDWNDCMAVVSAMREKFYNWTMEVNDEGEFYVEFWLDENESRVLVANTGQDAQRRAILVAALAAMGGEK